MKTKDLIAEAVSLPVEERAMVVDSLLKSLNHPKTDIDNKWTEVAKKRLSELRTGSIKALFPKTRFLIKSGGNLPLDILISS